MPSAAGTVATGNWYKGEGGHWHCCCCGCGCRNVIIIFVTVGSRVRQKHESRCLHRKLFCVPVMLDGSWSSRVTVARMTRWVVYQTLCWLPQLRSPVKLALLRHDLPRRNTCLSGTKKLTTRAPDIFSSLSPLRHPKVELGSHTTWSSTGKFWSRC